MSEKSYLWTTGEIGDGATPYSREDWQLIAQIFASCHGDEGVSPNFWSALAGMSNPGGGSDRTVRIAPGGAIVDGKSYASDANVDKVLDATPSNRRDRIVLRADWTAQTVRIHVIKGTDGSDTPPAITQSTRDVYDVMLYQAALTVGGTVTLTDERVLAYVVAPDIADAAVTTPKIVNQAVTTSKIASEAVTEGRIGSQAVTTTKLGPAAVTAAKIGAAAVDDTKVGARVPQLYRRQGGDANAWYIAGTGDRTPGKVRIQVGVIEVYVGDGSNTGSTMVNFPVEFSNYPIVFTSIRSFSGLDNPLTTYTSSYSTYQIRIHVRRPGSSGDLTATVYWMAIGPE